MSHKEAKTARKFLQLQIPFINKMTKEKGLNHCIFYHDDWCEILKGNEYKCTCDPEIKIVRFDDPKKDEEFIRESLARYKSWRENNK